MSQKLYKGLGNIGSICYINSFIQTLFMTPEFRDGIYSWCYNQKIHPKKQNSILFQLQKLFGKLQQVDSSVTTKDLIKSFQWHDDEAFNEQDIQEFNRVLFEAIQKSLSQSDHSIRHLIKQLYEGQLMHFTKCLECHNESVRQQNFQDIILTIKNIYQKIYNSSLQLSLQRYIKPELLDQNNLYQCGVCNKKVRAQRGVKFIKLPKFLNIVLQRFHFDYETMTRNKINDKFIFPFILNFNNYFNGYEQIPNKLTEDSSQYFLQQDVPKKFVSKTVAKPKIVSKNGTLNQPSVAGKIKTKSSANTKSFLQEMRKKKMQQSQQNNEDLIYISGKEPIPENINNEQNVQQVNSIPSYIPPPPPLSILESIATPSLQTPYNPVISKPSEKSKSNQPAMTIQTEMEKNKLEKQALFTQRIKNLSLHSAKNKQLIQIALKDGPLVYELYSILVHSGTANAGHYFSYIKSQQNERWYLFNDDRVSQINIVEIQKTFGGSGLSSAYVLYYRLVEEQKYKIQYKIPEYISKTIKQQQELSKIKQIEKLSNLENVLILKIYFQLAVKSIQINKTSTLQLLFEKCVQTFNINIIKDYSEAKVNETGTYMKEDNLRIRLFNPVNDIKLDTYKGKESLGLYQLGIRSYQNFILQTKGDSQEFEEYIAGFMSIRIALWEDNPNVFSLQQQYIKLHKVSIGRNFTMKQVQEVIKAKRQELLQQQEWQFSKDICIIKRHINDQYLYHQIINLPEYHQKNIDNIGIFEGEIVFVEADKNNLNWPKEFQNQIHRISVKFINSSNGHSQTILTDDRVILNTLKKTICDLINQPMEQTIIRRGNKSGLQLKNGQSILKDNRFINGTTLYLQRGLPAKVGQIRIQLFIASDSAKDIYNRLHQFEFIADVPIDSNLKASEVKQIFANVVKKIKNEELDTDNIRIRQKVNDKMGKVYREKPMKQQQLIEKRQIAIEINNDNLEMKDFSIYVRLWDQQNWKLSQKYEFLVNKNITMKHLAQQIYDVIKLKEQYIKIEVEDMDICRILSIHKFNIIDLVDMEYFGMVSEACVLGEPLFVNSDGLLYIIKQTGVEPRQLTKQEEQIFGGKIKVHVRPTRGRVATTNPTNKKKQKGIVIKVVQKSQEMQQESNKK